MREIDPLVMLQTLQTPRKSRIEETEEAVLVMTPSEAMDLKVLRRNLERKISGRRMSKS